MDDAKHHPKNEALRSINGSRQLTTQTTKSSPTSPVQSFVEKPTPLSSWRAPLLPAAPKQKHHLTGELLVHFGGIRATSVHAPSPPAAPRRVQTCTLCDGSS
jgi:hypothetical protein